MTELVPKALYQAVLAEFSAKGQLSQAPRNGNGQAQVGKRIDTVAQAQVAVTPYCPMHQKPMVFRQGRMVSFWSCPTRKPDGRWCPITKEVTTAGNGKVTAA